MLNRVPGKKIFIKADPGMGKTTLVKKIAWDWAKKLFTKVTIVYFVFLKLVKPGDTIESVIIDQTPELEGLGVTKAKLKGMLEKSGEKCLLILDGLDEHAFGKNQDVLEIVRHKKYLFCNVLLTSRPHSTRDIERYFDTIVSVEGFTKSEARKFALRIVPDAKKVEEILNFSPTDFRGGEYISLCNCPILLSFMCILVREDDIDLLSRKMPTGEIYARMVRCLYKKYLIRKGREFDESRFAEVLKLLGSLALKTLLSGNPFFKRTDVIREVGDDAFDHGLLIGHEDFRLIRDETADILITFAHRSIQEFLGSFCFVQKLTDGSTIDSLLGVDCQEPIFLVNPFFLHFCLWLLYCSKKYVSFQNRETACEILKSFILARIDCTQLHISDIVRLYPAIDFERAVNENDQLTMQFFGSVLEGIHKVKSLTLRTGDHLEWLLGHVRKAFDNLTVLKVCSKRYKSVFQGVTFDGLLHETLTMTLPKITTSDYCDEYLNIVLADEIYRSGMLEEILKYCKFSNKRPAVYLYLQDGEETDLSNLLHEDLYKVHVLSSTPTYVTMNQNIKRCPHLSHLSLVGRVRFDASVFEELNVAVRSRNLLNLKHLNLAGAMFYNVSVNRSFPLLLQYDFKGLCLSNFSLFCCDLSDSDIHALSLLKTTSLVTSGDRSVKLLPNALQNDTKTGSGSGSPLALALYELTRKGYPELINVLSRKQLSHLTELNLSMAPGQNCCLGTLKPNCIPFLEILKLERFITNLNDLKYLSQIVHGWDLRILDISHSSGISRHLTMLVKRRFSFLHTLVLSDCNLCSDDLSSLADAKQGGKLPKLQNLDISHNIEDLDCLFSFQCKWETLVSLNIRNDLGLNDCLQYLQRFVELGYLSSLETLRFYVDSALVDSPIPSVLVDRRRRGATHTLHTSRLRGLGTYLRNLLCSSGNTLEPRCSGTQFQNLTTLEIVSTLKDIEYTLTYARHAIKANSFPVLCRVCVVVKSNVTSDVKMDVLGDDWSDMSRARGLPLNYCHPDQNVQIRQPDDTKFAEALYELKKLGVEVHVWFSGDEQFTKKTGVM